MRTEVVRARRGDVGFGLCCHRVSCCYHSRLHPIPVCRTPHIRLSASSRLETRISSPSQTSPPGRLTRASESCVKKPALSSDRAEAARDTEIRLLPCDRAAPALAPRFSVCVSVVCLCLLGLAPRSCLSPGGFGRSLCQEDSLSRLKPPSPASSVCCGRGVGLEPGPGQSCLS